MNKKIKFKSLSELWLEQATLGVTYTYKSNLESYVKHLNNAFGSQPVASIKPYDLDLLIRQLYICNPNTNKPSSKKLLVNIVNCATRIFDFAIENEVMYKNPAKNKKKSIPKNAPRKTVNALNSEQQQLVIETEHRAKTAAVIMMFMGLRTGEILALEWNDVDLDNYVVSVKAVLEAIQTSYGSMVLPAIPFRASVKNSSAEKTVLVKRRSDDVGRAYMNVVDVLIGGEING